MLILEFLGVEDISGEWPIIFYREGGLQNGKIAGPRPFVPQTLGLG